MDQIATDPLDGVETDPLAGTAYRSIRLLGTGAMGQVFEAEHVALRRRVAVKVLTPSLVGSPAFVDRLRLEAQALASVRHPNVVGVHDHAVTPSGVPFLVMELLHGRTLQDVLRERSALPLLEAMSLLDQIFAGLTAIHAAGLMHRDLKPANVFLCEEQGRRVAKVLDFGLVKVTRPEAVPSVQPLLAPTEPGHVLGTPRFMAPEQIAFGICDARADVYAAGVLTFLLLAGCDPFHHHRAQMAVLTAHARETPPLLSTVAKQRIPPGVDAAVARALAKNPSERFGSIAEFGAALSVAILGGGAGLHSARAGTEKIPAGTEKLRDGAWSRPPRVTEPFDSPPLQAIRSVLPFAAQTEPSREAPDDDRARLTEDDPLRDDRAASRKASPSFGTELRAASSSTLVRGFFLLVALLWGLVLVAALWRMR